MDGGAELLHHEMMFIPFFFSHSKPSAQHILLPLLPIPLLPSDPLWSEVVIMHRFLLCLVKMYHVRAALHSIGCWWESLHVEAKTSDQFNAFKMNQTEQYHGWLKIRTQDAGRQEELNSVME